MASAKITIWGFNNYLLDNNDNLFKNLTLPDGIDKELLIENILLKANEFELLYANPYFMQLAIGTWSRKWFRTFDKWIAALNIEYNPLENYDRIEEWTERNTGTVKDEGSNTGTVYTDGASAGTDTSNGSIENKVSAYNSNEYENDNNTTSTNTSTTSANSHNTTTNNLANYNLRTDNLTNNKTGRSHGNIGVTTSQQMLESELEIARWNIYEQITDIFLSEFVIPIY